VTVKEFCKSVSQYLMKLWQKLGVVLFLRTVYFFSRWQQAIIVRKVREPLAYLRNSHWLTTCIQFRLLYFVHQKVSPEPIN